MSSEGWKVLHCKDTWTPKLAFSFPRANLEPSSPTALLGDLLGFTSSAGIFLLTVTLVLHSFYNER